MPHSSYLKNCVRTKSEQSRSETRSESTVDQAIGWCAHKQGMRGAKTSNAIKIISLSRKTECLFTVEWLTFIQLTFNTMLLPCCYSCFSSGHVFTATGTKACRWELVEVTEVQEVWLSLPRLLNRLKNEAGGYNFGLCCILGRGGDSAVLGCLKGGGTHFHFLCVCGGDLSWNDPIR